MSIINYTTLVSAVGEAMEDDSSEFAAYVPKAIGLAEFRLSRLLDNFFFTTTSVVAMTSSNRTLSKPSDLLAVRDLFITNNNETSVLIKTTDGFIYDYWPYANASVGTPKYYADLTKDTWLIAPTPSDNYSTTIVYDAKLAPLSASVSTNRLTDFCPDALFYATMIEMCKFAKNWSAVQSWEAHLLEAILGINNEGRRHRRDDQTNPANTDSNQNTLQGNN